jgi:hypothetical protein
MNVRLAKIQKWDHLLPGDPVTVAEFGQAAYAACVDVLTDDAEVIWILPETGAGRRAFDCREDVVIKPLYR